jgi:hypothetical protein
MSIKKVEMKLIVHVDTKDEIICPSGDPTEDNVVLNAIHSDFFLERVDVVKIKEVNDEL